MKQLILFIALLMSYGLSARPTRFFEHYSTDDGLPQNVVTDIVQDRKGFMWFSTWNGFARFDGKRFKNFRLRSTDSYAISSSRFEHIYEDKLGFIWLESYDNKAHRFDPATETFTGLSALESYRNKSFLLSKISIQPSGKVWLISGKHGCICVLDSAFNIREFTTENNMLYSDLVYEVYEDKQGDSWILTDNGLYQLKKDSPKPIPYFINSPDTGSFRLPFYCYADVNDEIWFGSSRGQLRRYNKEKKTFGLVKLPCKQEINGIYASKPVAGKGAGDTQATKKQGGQPDTSFPEELVITTSGGGIFILRLSDLTIENYTTTNSTVLKDNYVRGNYVDKQGQLWFQTREPGIYKIDIASRAMRYYSTSAHDAAINVFPSGTKIREDINGRLWIHPRGGGFSYYDAETDELLPFNNDDATRHHQFSNILHSLYCDRQGNLWFCSRSLGLEKVSFSNHLFQKRMVSTDLRSTISNNVRAVLQDHSNRIWVATKEGRVVVYDSAMNYLGDVSANGTISKNGRFGSMVYCMMKDRSNTIWLGTKTDGLFRARPLPGSTSYNIDNYKTDHDDEYSLSDNVIYSIFEDSRHRIWVGSYGGGLNLIERPGDKKLRFLNYRNRLSHYPATRGARIRVIDEDRQGVIYVGTTNGLIVFKAGFQEPETIQFRHFAKEQGKPESLSNNDIHDICITTGGDIYLATFGGGLNKLTRRDRYHIPQAFSSFTTSDGLPSDVCLSAIEDRQGAIWIGTENNLTRFQPSARKFTIFADIRKLVNTTNFSEATRIVLHNGDLIFGLTEGFLQFNPTQIKDNTFKPYIALIDFKLNNQSIEVNTPGSVLERTLDDTRLITLRHHQNSFSFEYSALDFVNTDNIHYAFMLEGFDEEWNYVQKQRTATYTNIPRGNYTFKVKSTNSDGSWIENERTIHLRILPSFWETPFAIALYVVVLILIFLATLRILFSFYRLKKDVEIEKQLSEMKLRFFTDISHEIRTPLTMIAGPIDYLLEEPYLPDNFQFHLKLISQNTNRMLRLVNQILDLRKAQQKKLHLQETDLGRFAENLYAGFTDLANRHKIHFTFTNNAPGETLWVDRNCLEIILMNLLSNAFKYTPDNEKIDLSINTAGTGLVLILSDTGKGISKENQKKLFKRFVSFSDDTSKPSTGIGLSIVNDLVNKHKGKITLESAPGKGSTFTIWFPTGLNQFDENDVEILENPTGETPPAGASRSENDQAAPNRPTLLLVEDDDDLRQFIGTALRQDFQVTEAENGQLGYEMLLQVNPDLVISDVMMPVMDGIDLLRKIKTNVESSHIPVILLTAKSTIESKLEGLDSGADDYITKPFSIAYLRARILNLLEQRQRLQKIYQTQFDSTAYLKIKTATLTIGSRDELFMKKTIELIETTMEDPNFVIDDLVQKLGMSRSVFYTKIKSLTGLSPIDFIKDIKLQRAARLLESGEYMIKEVAFMIGISDMKHFREIFKTKFGLSPSEYRNKSKNEH